MRLDRSLLKVQEDKRRGLIDEPGYQEFLTKFRMDLEAAISLAEPTPANTALHARLLLSIGDSNQALATLGSAIDRDPANPALRAALGQAHYDRKDYPAALAEADAILAIDPKNKAALALKHSSQGRIGAGGAASHKADRIVPREAGTERIRSPLPKDPPTMQALAPKIKAARDSGDFQKAMTLTQELMRAEPTSKSAQEIYRVVAKDHARWQRGQKNAPPGIEGKSVKKGDGRPLTSQEKALVKEVYGEKVDSSKVRIISGEDMTLWGRILTIKGDMVTWGNTIYIPNDERGKSTYSFEKQPEWLIHEMAHVGQYQGWGQKGKGGWGYAARSVWEQLTKGKHAYDLGTLDPNKPFEEYTIEQQAVIVEGYHNTLSGNAHGRGCASTPQQKAALEAICRKSGLHAARLAAGGTS